MKELFDKITTYNLFNYLFPGILLAVFLEKFTIYSIFEENIIISVFIYYFLGMIISRIGSLFIEPILKKSGFLEFSEYKDYIFASEKDSKIELFNELNNTYRTIISLLTFILSIKIYETIEQYFNLVEFRFVLFTSSLIILFLYSYKKQTEYIKKRIDYHKDKNN